MLVDAPLRRQLLLWLLPPIAIVWLVSAYFTYNLAHRFATDAYDRALYDSAIAIAGQVRIERGRLAVDLPQIAQKILESDLRDQIFYMVSAPDGEFVMGYSGMPPPPAPSAASLARKAAALSADASPDSLRPPRYYTADFRGQALRIAAMNVPLAPLSDGAQSGYALVQVGETLGDREEMARDILIAALVPQFVLMLLLSCAIYIGLGRGLLPLEVLRRDIESRSSRDLGPVKENRAPPEIRRLVNSLNGLLARMAQTLATQQRFIADAAHQLRTPTAALKTQVEVAQRTRDPGEIQARLGQIHLAAERHARLVNQLLSLARAEPGGTEPITHRPLDLLGLVRAETEYWVPQAIARSIDLGFEVGCARRCGPLQVHGDPVMLAELLGNLIDNALRYTQPGGTVTVSVARLTGPGDIASAQLTVEDDGPGIPDDEREQVFERFHRVLGTGTEGAGLGLAIVREIALAHGGQVELSPGANGAGARFTVTLPLSLPPAASDAAQTPAQTPAQPSAGATAADVGKAGGSSATMA